MFLVITNMKNEVEELLQELEDIDRNLSFGVLFPALSGTVNASAENQEKKEEPEEKSKISSVPPPPKLIRQRAEGEKESEFGALLEELEDIERTLAFGVKININGGEYEGEVNSNGKPHGQGVWTHPSGRRYEGQCKNGKKHGQGTYTWPDGARYEGEWQDGKYHGQGLSLIHI